MKLSQRAKAQIEMYLQKNPEHIPTLAWVKIGVKANEDAEYFWEFGFFDKAKIRHLCNSKNSIESGGLTFIISAPVTLINQLEHKTLDYRESQFWIE